MRINIKPLSVNRAWQGKRYKTPSYKSFEKNAFMLLPIPSKVDIPDRDLKVYYEFGFSSKLADYDNPIKPFQDILQRRYGFNDSRIVEAHIKKVVVKKGEEYIEWRIEALNP